MWSGTVTFGLVSIPVSLLPGIRSTRVAMRMLDDDGSPLSRRYYCPAENKEIGSDEMVRGYEVERERFVVLQDEELEALAPEKSRDIDLQRFVDLKEIDPVFFDHPYYLVPREGSTKAYRLLARTMEESAKAGIATFVMREKEYLIAILAQNGILRAETLRFADQIRTTDFVGLPAKEKVAQKEVDRIERAIESVAVPALDPNDLRDERNQRLTDLVAEKDEHGRDVVEVEVELESGEESVIDLMERLQQSLRSRKTKPGGLPIADYDRLPAAELEHHFGELDREELELLLDYESQHKNRKSVRRAIERNLARDETPQRTKRQKKAA